MHPFLFTAPVVHVRVLSAQAMLVLAVVAGLWLVGRLGHSLEGLDTRTTRRAGAWVTIAMLAGARLHFVLNHWYLFADRPLTAFAVWSGGRHAVAGVVCGLLAAPLACRAYGLPARKLADCGSIAVGLGLAITRVGCFLHGCCFGTMCDWPWCMGFPPSSPAYNLQAPLGLLPPGATRSLPVHPLQLYFAAAALLGAAFLRWLEPRKRYDGQVVIVSLVLYSASSAALELLRYDYRGRPYWGALPQLLWVALAAAGASLAALAIAETIHAWRSRQAASPSSRSSFSRTSDGSTTGFAR